MCDPPPHIAHPNGSMAVLPGPFYPGILDRAGLGWPREASSANMWLLLCTLFLASPRMASVAEIEYTTKSEKLIHDRSKCEGKVK